GAKKTSEIKPGKLGSGRSDRQVRKNGAAGRAAVPDMIPPAGIEQVEAMKHAILHLERAAESISADWLRSILLLLMGQQALHVARNPGGRRARHSTHSCPRDYKDAGQRAARRAPGCPRASGDPRLLWQHPKDRHSTWSSDEHLAVGDYRRDELIAR